MADYKHFRIVLDLSAFFYDHRRVARIFVKKNLKSIADLQNRISEIFEISEFYLTTGGHFLPTSEDIRVLSNHESVCLDASLKDVASNLNSTEIPREAGNQSVSELHHSSTSVSYEPSTSGLQQNPSYDVFPTLLPRFICSESKSEWEANTSISNVIPKKIQEIAGHPILPVTSSTHHKKQKKHKRPLESILEDSIETPTRTQKKHIGDTTFSSSSFEDEVPRKKRKSGNNEGLAVDETCSSKSNQKKQNVEIAGSNHLDSSSWENRLSQDNNQSIVEREISNIEASQKIIDIKKKLKQQADEYVKNHSKNTCNLTDTSNIKNVLPKLQSHIKNCNDLGRSNLPDTVRLSRHVDTPIKRFSPYKPPVRITDQYLAKNKINIVKIDVVQKGGKDLIDQSNMSHSFESRSNIDPSSENIENSNSQKSDESPPKNYVKEVISTFEKTISPDSKSHIAEEKIIAPDEPSLEAKETRASNYTKAFLDQREPITLDNSECTDDKAVNFSNNSVDVPEPNKINGLEDQKNLLPKLFKTEEPVTTKLLDEGMESTNISVDISSISQDTSHLSGNSRDSTINCTDTSQKFNDSSLRSQHSITNTKFGGVGSLLGRLRESDSMLSQESDGSSQYVTKRKRIRKHKRKNKKGDEGQKLTPNKVETYVVRPMNVKACPSLHIKFEDNEMEILEDKSLIIDDGNNKTESENCLGNENGDILQTPVENKSVLLENIELSDEDNDPIMENKSIFGEESISKAPLMTNKLEPKVGDVIAFKVLRLTENYSPQVSNYIVGKLEIYVDKTTVYFKILRGEEELLPPSGKLSLDGNTDVQKTKYKEFLWTDLIAPKLLYP